MGPNLGALQRGLVDLDARAEALSGETVVTPGPGVDGVTFRVTYAGDRGAMVTLPVTDAATELVALRTPTDQLSGVHRLDPFVPVACFAARADGAHVLGAAITSVTTTSASARVEMAFGHCVSVWVSRAEEGPEALEAVTVSLAVTMAGLTRAFEVIVPAPE